jgi:hypothetical protein
MYKLNTISAKVNYTICDHMRKLISNVTLFRKVSLCLLKATNIEEIIQFKRFFR